MQDILVNYASTQSGIVQVLLAIAAPLAAFIAVGVAIWQARLQRRQLDLNLYQKRLDVYLAVRGFLSSFAIEGKTDLDKNLMLIRNTKEAEFLFRPEIPALIDEIYKKATSWRTMEAVRLQHNGAVDEKMVEAENWLSDTATQLAAERFRPYLQMFPPPKRHWWSRLTTRRPAST
jgi:hypothetical protein